MKIEDLRTPRANGLIIESNNLLIQWLTLHGKDTDSFVQIINRLHNDNIRLQVQSEGIQKAIDTISNPSVREMIRLHQSGMTWSQVCRRIYKYDSPTYCRRLVVNAIESL